MSISALSEFTRISRYAQYRPDKQRRENWREQISERVMAMHRQQFPQEELRPFLDEAEDLMLRKRVLGSQRILQFGGKSVLRKNARAFNCMFSQACYPRFFQEYIWLLLCGCGVGFSVQKHHVQKLPTVKPSAEIKPVKYTIPDSIEGWANAIGVLLSEYFTDNQPFPEFYNKRVLFDFSAIRPKGAALSSGTKAPGPDPLRRSIDKISKLLKKNVKQERQLRPIEVYDICMYAADAVISGGIRRAATTAIFSPDDQEMIEAKTGAWFSQNPQRARSNNSALLLRDQVSREEFDNFFKFTKQFGEPGFVWSNDTEWGFNPCFEASLVPLLLDPPSDIELLPGQIITDTPHGRAAIGFQACNLCEINGKAAKTEEEFLEACDAAATLGTLQAAYTDMEYLGEVSEQIIRQEALLGVSITGMMDNPELLFDPQVQQLGVARIRVRNEQVAEIIGIKPAARLTNIKPAGKSSCILQTASGIHPHHARRYFRHVQANEEENQTKFFELYNDRAVEQSVYDPNNVTKCITFLCEVPPGARTKNQISGLDLLKKVKSTQRNWVIPGTVEDRCIIPGVVHNVSNTIHVKNDEWDQVADYLWDNRDYFAGVSFIGTDGDKDYAQAPFTKVFTPRQIVSEYGDAALFASGLIEDALAESTWGDLWAACATVLGQGEDLSNTKLTNHAEKDNWANRLQRFADRYLEGNCRKATYCLKDIHNWKKWVDLSREYTDVPWHQMTETEDNQNFGSMAACAGGKCEI